MEALRKSSNEEEQCEARDALIYRDMTAEPGTHKIVRTASKYKKDDVQRPSTLIRIAEHDFLISEIYSGGS